MDIFIIQQKTTELSPRWYIVFGFNCPNFALNLAYIYRLVYKIRLPLFFQQLGEFFLDLLPFRIYYKLAVSGLFILCIIVQVIILGLVEFLNEQNFGHYRHPEL